MHHAARFRPRVETLEDRTTPLAAGSLDPTFGTGGVVDTVGLGFSPVDVVVDASGRPILVGTAGGDIAVARLTTAGVPDTSFGGDGLVHIDFGVAETGNAIALDPTTGNIVVAGDAPSKSGAVARLLPDGSLDPAFGTGGKVLISSAVYTIGAEDVAVDATGHVVTVGGASNNVVARLLPNGTFDPAFNGGEVLLTGPRGDDGTYVAIDGNQRIVIGGTQFIAPPGSRVLVPKFSAARVNPDGSIDHTFSGPLNVSVVLDIDSTTPGRVRGMAVDADDNVYLVGVENAGRVAAKLTPTGSLDPSFGSGGYFVGFEAGAGILAATVREDGRLVVCGTELQVAQLTAAGALDPTFNPAGTTPGVVALPTQFVLKAATVGPDGKIVVAGGDTLTRSVAVRLLGEVTASEAGGLSVGGPGGAAGLYQREIAIEDGFTGRYAIPPAATLQPFGDLGAIDVRTAVADVDGDGVEDTVLVTGPGTPIRVAVVSGTDNSTFVVDPFDPFGGDFTGGGFVSAADIDRDGQAEFVVSPDTSGGPRVVIFSFAGNRTATPRTSFLGIDDANFRGGCRTALGDVNGDGVIDLVVAAGSGGGPRAALFDGESVFDTPARIIGDFFAFPGDDMNNLRNGVFVAAGDVDADGYADLVFGGGPGGAPRVYILSGKFVVTVQIDAMYNSPIANFFVAGNSSDRGGVRVATRNADGDSRTDVAVGSGTGSPSRVRVYLGKDLAGAEPANFQDLTPFGGSIVPNGVFVG